MKKKITIQEFLMLLVAAYFVYEWFKKIFIPDAPPTIQLQPFQVQSQAPQQILMRQGGGNNAKAYNNVKQMQINSGDSYALEPGTVHSYSYSVFGGNCKISIDGQELDYIDGDYGSDTATETFNQRIVFAPQAGCNVRLKITY